MSLDLLAECFVAIGIDGALKDLQRMIRNVFTNDFGVTFHKIVNLYAGNSKIKKI